MTTADRQQVFGRRGWLAGLPADFQSAILDAAHERRFGKGDTIFEAGDEPGGIYGILSGSIGCWISSDYCETTLAHVARQGDWFGEGPVTTGQRRTMGFRALEPVVLLHVALPALRQITQVDATTARHLAVLAEKSAQLAIRCMCDLLIPDPMRRLAAVLLRVTGAEAAIPLFGAEGARLTNAEIGEMVGFSRCHVNRLLRQLQARGLVRLGYNHIVVADFASLVELASGELVQGLQASA